MTPLTPLSLIPSDIPIAIFGSEITACATQISMEFITVDIYIKADIAQYSGCSASLVEYAIFTMNTRTKMCHE